MADSKLRNTPACLAEDELLAEAVRKYPALYDKRLKDYKDRNVCRNAWEKVANSLDFVEDGK